MAQEGRPPADTEAEGSAFIGLIDFEEQTEVGELYLRALVRRQWRLSIGVALVFVGFLLAQPALARLWPEWGRLKLAGVPLAWLVLGVGAYPLLIWLGSLYVRRAEEVDQEFTDLLR